MSWLLRVIKGERVWECPCGDFRVTATRRTADSPMVDAALGAHYRECVVAQADLILRTDGVDGSRRVE